MGVRGKLVKREYSQEIQTTEQLGVRASMVAHRDKERERSRETVQIVEMMIRETDVESLEDKVVDHKKKEKKNYKIYTQSYRVCAQT